jgi:hypothetical protein
VEVIEDVDDAVYTPPGKVCTDDTSSAQVWPVSQQMWSPLLAMAQ